MPGRHATRSWNMIAIRSLFPHCYYSWAEAARQMKKFKHTNQELEEARVKAERQKEQRPAKRARR